jgi:DNA-binding IclR family transcriptional regulator
MAAKMARALEILIDGKWHALKEIKQKTKLNKNQIQQVIDFLERYGFISVNKIARKIRLDKSVKKFLAENSTS